MGKQVVIRADGNAMIGAGHIMRCLTIAQALPVEATPLFLCADEKSCSIVRTRGFEAVCLHTSYTNLMSEMAAWARLKEQKILDDYPAILVDSYYVTPEYIDELKEFGKVFLLEDMGIGDFGADVLINYNVFASRELYEDVSCERMLLGGSYVPIRPEFLRTSYEVRNTVKNILITTGGGDCDNIAKEILDAIYWENATFYVVTGAFNPNRKALEEYAKTKTNVEICVDVQDMSALMAHCDVAISAGGTTVYELCAVGVPMVCFSYADNQNGLVSYMGVKGICESAGRYHVSPAETLERIVDAVEKYVDSVGVRQSTYEKEKYLIDGKGAARIAKELLS